MADPPRRHHRDDADPAGQVDVSQVTPKLRVLLGLTELPVTWSHNGPVWSTRLAPRNVGPTVIRVVAEDEFGDPLGRHFLEVDEKPAKPGETASPPRRVAHNSIAPSAHESARPAVVRCEARLRVGKWRP